LIELYRVKVGGVKVLRRKWGGVGKLASRKPTWVLSKIGKHVGDFFLVLVIF
jgi:hypothetical protein